MNLQRVRAIMRKELWHITRDRRTALLVTLSPVLFLIVLAYSFSIEIDRVALAAYDQDMSPLSRAYLAGLGDSGDLEVCCAVRSYAELEAALTRGDVKAALVIPPGFMRAIEAGRSADLQVIVDGTDPATASHAIRHIGARSEGFALAQARRQLRRAGLPEPLLAPPIDLRLRTWYNPSLRYLIGMVPALIGLVLAMPAMAASLAITREKEWGTLEGLISTPVGRLELLLGKLLPYLGVGMTSVVGCLLVAVFWFRIPLRGSPVTFLLLAGVYLLAALSIGLLISVLVRSQQAAMVLALLVFLFPGFFLSGILIPLAAMGPMKHEAMLLPTTHFVVISRGIFVKGLGLRLLWPWALALLGIGLAGLGLAVARFHKRLA